MTYRSASLLLLGTLLLFSACSDTKQIAQQKAPPPLPVEVITVTKEKIPIWLQYTGKTKASSDQVVRARVSGNLEAIYFHDGDHVTKGQKLFKIEQTQYKADLEAAQAAKRRDEASLALAKADVARYAPLVKDGLAPRATLEQHQARFDELTAQISADKANISNAKLRLSYTIIDAPVSGRISARRVDVGNLVGTGESTELTTILQVDPIYAYFAPTENEVQLIQKFRSKKKLDAFIEVRGSGEEILQRKRLNGYVDFADNTVDPLTSTISMRATISNPDSQTLPGTFVYVNIFVTDQETFTMVPPQVIFSDQLGDFVYKVGKEGKAVRQSVKTGFSSRYYTNIKEGLEPGDQIVISGLMKVKPGRVLRPQDVSDTKGIMAVLKANDLIPEAK